jgi:hypothetical protein
MKTEVAATLKKGQAVYIGGSRAEAVFVSRSSVEGDLLVKSPETVLGHPGVPLWMLRVPIRHLHLGVKKG